MKEGVKEVLFSEEDISIRTKELAKIIGISQQQLSQYEKGINYPKIEIAKKLSDFFNISINEIFF